jgi:uncharacterized YigZ family protein
LPQNHPYIIDVPEDLLKYKVPREAAEYRLNVKGSRFIGWCAPAGDEEAAQAAIAGRCRLQHSATHNCWAYRVGSFDDPLERSSDAGEPSGTAGRPILDQIKHCGLHRAVVVVSRWFGGTKLGRGGLVRAYGDCAAGCLELVSTGEVIPTVRLEVSCEYPLIGLVENLTAKFSGRVVHGGYAENARLTCEIPGELVEAFRTSLTEASAGKAGISPSAK